MPTDDLPDWIRRHRWEVGDRLRVIRLARGLTQEQLAEQAGIDNKTVSRAENGHTALDIDMLASMARVLGVPSWRFLRDDYVTGGGSGAD